MERFLDADAYLKWLSESMIWSKAGSDYRHPDGSLKDRLIRHDVIHLLITDRPYPIKLRYKDECPAAITQAVLESDPKITTMNHLQVDNLPTHTITEAEVRGHIIPGTNKLLRMALKQLNKPIPDDFQTDLSSERINELLDTAKKFRKAFKETYGDEFMTMPIEKFMTIPPADLKNLYNSCIPERAISVAI